MGKTISITIPDKLEAILSAKAKQQGISRSRLIGNILLQWEGLLHIEESNIPLNECVHFKNGFCRLFKTSCSSIERIAKQCSGYIWKRD